MYIYTYIDCGIILVIVFTCFSFFGIDTHTHIFLFHTACLAQVYGDHLPDFVSLLCESPSLEGGGNTLIDGQAFLASLVIWRFPNMLDFWGSI